MRWLGQFLAFSVGIGSVGMLAVALSAGAWAMAAMFAAIVAVAYAVWLRYSGQL